MYFRGHWIRAFLAGLGIACGASAQAGETVTYNYDVLGRLAGTSTNNGLTTSITYDAAGNRSNYSVAGVTPPPAFSVNDVTATEGSTLTFTVLRTGVTTSSHSVTYGTANGTALAGSDYTTAGGTLTFAPGDTSKTVTVATIDDPINEGNETLSLNLSGPTGGATLADALGVGTITDNDPPPAFSVNDVTATEGGTLTFTVLKTGATTSSHNVTYGTANGTAFAGSDYTTAGGTLTFAPGDTSKTVSIATINDSLDELNGTFSLNLSGVTGGATIADAMGVGTIVDDDAGPVFSINDASATEGGGLVFTVTKTGATSVTYNVSGGTADGSAVAGADYIAVSGTLTFAPAETSRTVVIDGIQDSMDEPNETFNLNILSSDPGSTIGDGQGAGTIVDDDPSSFGMNGVSSAEPGSLTSTASIDHRISSATWNGAVTSAADAASSAISGSSAAGLDGSSP